MDQINSLRTENKFKKTEIGEIPVDWGVVSTKDILKNANNAMRIGPFGSQLKKEYFVEAGYKVYGQENVFDNDFSLGNRRISSDRYKMLKAYKIEPGDVVITMMGTVGKCAIVPNDIEPGIMDSHLLRLEIDENKYSKELLVQIVSSSGLIKKQIKTLSVGGIMEGLSSSIVKQLYFPKPPIREQKKIAEILSSVDETIEKKKSIIEKTKELKKGLMQELLTRGIGHKKFKKTELGEIPEEWEVISISDILENTSEAMRIGPFGSQLKKEYFVEVGYKVYGQENVFNNDFSLGNRRISSDRYKMLQAYKIVPGDVVITMMGTVGKCTIVPNDIEPGIMDSHLLRLQIDENKYSKELFIQIVTNSDLIKRQIRMLSVGGIMEGLSSSIIKQLLFPKPILQEQKKIADVLSSLDRITEKVVKHRERIEFIKKGLMQLLLIGITRVKI